jgi:hypothetical protein
MYVPGLVRDIEESIYTAIVARGVEHIEVVRSLLSGYDAISGMCFALGRILSNMHPVTDLELRLPLATDGCLFIFHTDKEMTLVFDMEHRNGWMREELGGRKIDLEILLEWFVERARHAAGWQRRH